MSSSGYSPYSSRYSRSPSPSPSSNNYQVLNPTHLWGNWSVRPPPPPPPPPPYAQNYNRNPPAHRECENQNHNSTIPNNHINANNPAAFRLYGGHISRCIRPPYRQGPNPNDPNWPFMYNNFKRPLDFPANEKLNKTGKKRKKSSSSIQSEGPKKYTDEEAELAYSVEKEFNRKLKPALIIKFPDQDLNKDIVAQFHPAIENVHFQQPCIARFCFVTLQDSANPDEVISELNKQKFGSGYLTAEYKKDKEEEQNVSARDIDPLTLYVGNLAQGITKENIVSLFPRNKRIDIGYAKKMRFTRYAFISFSKVKDSIEAFKNAFNKQLHNKSLIVRFRRLHGTVGMPGEVKPQHPPRNRNDTANGSDENRTEVNTRPSDVDHPQPPCNSTLSVEETYDSYSDITEPEVSSRIKQELDSPDERSFKNNLDNNRCLPISADLDEYLHFQHSPIKDHIKQEVITDKDVKNTNIKMDIPRIKTEVMQSDVRIKDEPYDSDGTDSRYNDTDEYFNEEYLGSEDADSDISEPTNFSEIYATMRQHQERIEPLKKT